MPPRPRLHALVPALALTLGGCATSPPPGIPTELSGHYTVGPGVSWLRPCPGTDPAERLWITWVEGAAAAFAEARNAARIADGEERFVRVRGERVTDGRVGPGGPALLATALVELRPAAEGDCGAPPADHPLR